MCGIAGIVDFNNHDTLLYSRILKKMTDTLFHRGPDDFGFFIDNQAYLGHRRLSIIDLKTGHQPVFNEKSSVVIVYNGEVYNFKELKKSLTAHEFYTKTDTEVLVHLYEEYGSEFVLKLNGMFSFALWDREKQRLILARDVMGQKPLYYYPESDFIMFSSEIRSIIESGYKKWEICERSLSKFLLYDSVPAPFTILKGVYKLKPGEILIFEKGKPLKIYPYFDVPQPEEKITDLHEALHLFEKEIERSVSYRLLSDVPLGLFLSGGLDSTVVLNEMAKFLPGKKINTFSIGFEDRSFDESGFAKTVARHYGTTHHEETLTPQKMIRMIPEIIDKMDEPLGDPSFVPTYLLSRFTRKFVKVALGGDGGDELFLGYQTFIAHPLAEIFSKVVPDFLKKGIIKTAVNLIPPSEKNISLDYQLKKFVEGAFYKPFHRHFVWIGALSPYYQKKLFTNPEIVDDVFSPVESYIKTYSKNGKISSLDLASYLYMKLYLHDVILVKVDRASMANSLEVRAPFLDRSVVTFSRRIPNKFKLNGFTTKFLLRKYLEGKLPPEIVNRKKKGFGIPLTSWLKNDLMGFMVNSILPQTKKRLKFFNYRFIELLIKEHLNNRRDNRKALWNLIVFHNWVLKNINFLKL